MGKNMGTPAKSKRGVGRGFDGFTAGTGAASCFSGPGELRGFPGLGMS